MYEELGITRVINCFGTYTLIGGATLSHEVRAAMEEADTCFAWMWELEEKAGRRIAELTGAEAAFVTPGAFAALAMSAAVCMAGRDTEKMSRLPDTTGMKNEFIIQKCLRDFKYDRSMTIAGGKLVEVGDEFQGCTPEKIEAAITDRTAGIHYMAHGTTGDFASKDCNIVPLEEVVEIAHNHGIPVIVDAAFQCYPLEGFTKFVAMGADLVGVAEHISVPGLHFSQGNMLEEIDECVDHPQSGHFLLAYLKSMFFLYSLKLITGSAFCESHPHLARQQPYR